MGKNSGIEWTDHTWNPWRGCRKVSPGCKNCYMFRDQRRYGQDPGAIVRAADATFRAPLKWRDPAQVFTCSWSDFFLKDADPWRPEAWAIIRETPQLKYLILTKRPENIATRLPSDWGEGYPNVALGVSVEDQPTAEERIPKLLWYPADIHWVSAEPLIGPLRLGPWIRFNGYNGYIEWVVAGGESGPGFRPLKLEWLRRIRDECKTMGSNFFLKQIGGNKKVDGAWGGNQLDGRTHLEPCPFNMWRAS